jgi:hypothetical protein
VLESEVQEFDDAGHICSFSEVEPSGSFGTPIEVYVRRTSGIIFGDPDLEKVDVGDEAGLLLYQGSLYMRVGGSSIEIQVPGSAGPGRDDRAVLLELGSLAAQSMD